MRKIQRRDKLTEIEDGIEYHNSTEVKVDTLIELMKINRGECEMPAHEQPPLPIFEYKFCGTEEDALLAELNFYKMILTKYLESCSIKLPVVPRNENETDEEYSERYYKRITEFIAKLNKGKAQGSGSC